MIWIWLAITAYFAVNLAINAWAARRIRSESDYLVAGRSLGPGLVAVSLFATWFGAETVIGSSAAVSTMGLAGGRADPFGYSLCLLGMGLFLAYRMRARNYVTLGDFFRERYSRAAELFGSALFIPSVVTWAGAQLLALAHILVVLTGIDLQAALALSVAIAVLYTWLGGMLGGVLSNAFQTLVILTGLAVLLVVIVGSFGGLIPALERIEPSQLTFVAKDETPLARLDLLAVPILGSLVSQAAFGRLFAARSPEVARNACFGAFAIYLSVGLVPVTIALLAPHLGITLAEGDGFLMALAKSLLSPVMFVIFMGALISVVLSTVVGTLITIAALASHNLILPARPDLGERERVLITRVLVAVSGVGAYFIAAAGENVLGLVIFADSLGTSGLLVTIVIGLYFWRFGGPAAAMCAFAAGLAGFPLGNYALGLDAPFLFSVALALAAYVGVAVWERTRPAPRTRM
jgi:Na+/proline symporter